MFQDKTDIAAGERLRQSNYNLKSTVQELRLEIAYYQGEAKRLEWEKNGLKQDVGKMSALFKGWLHELQCSNTRSIVDETDYFKNLVANPSKNISEILQSKDIKLLLTSCQAPFYVEYTNQAWTLECGWDSHEILGLTCAFMQGEVNDISIQFVVFVNYIENNAVIISNKKVHLIITFHVNIIAADPFENSG